MKKLTLALSAAALALAGGAAYAQQGGMGPGGGTMTWEQVKTRADAMFDRMDVNHDGVLSQADRDAMKAKMFDKIDTNHDGVISREEFMAAHPPRGDHGMRGPMGGPGAGQQMGHGMHGKWGREGHHGWMGHRGRGMMMMMLHKADANHDGQVTKAEFDTAVKAHFDQVDTNHDGKISKEERQAFHAAMRAKMQQGWKGHGGMNRGDMPPPPPAGGGE